LEDTEEEKQEEEIEEKKKKKKITTMKNKMIKERSWNVKRKEVDKSRFAK
jgi:hypothetical protein